MTAPSFRDRIFILDLHNTLYDEVIEYGTAIQAAVDYLAREAQRQGRPIDREAFYRQIAAGHARLESDWDDDVWSGMEVLKDLEERESHIRKAVALRLKESERLTREHAYRKTIDAIRDLKGSGARVCIATEATANAAANAVRWLDLDGVIDALYSWPYRKPYRPLDRTAQKNFPGNPERPDIHLQKPHPHILAEIILDAAKEDGKIDGNVQLEDVAARAVDNGMDLSTLTRVAPENDARIQEAVKALRTRITLRDTRWKPVLESYWSRTFYAGDSFFKDGFLALNAGIPFIHAAYGKKTKDLAGFEKAKQILNKATGWEPLLMQLTQDASTLPVLTGRISPSFICRDSFHEFIHHTEVNNSVANY